ncbi:RxLR effector protein [Phytophthora megakarya]|uniref:RxLR effector protein n=1 Tax=Phytophthora megakarya TaxID=4795 RepID=A0A225V756_9STRA|nr:RxLR effector protein [Phytophthora megakarya]
MRPSSLVLFAAGLVAICAGVSKADVSNVGIVYPSGVIADEDKRFLRSGQSTNGNDSFDDEAERPEGDEEERAGGANLLSAMKQSNMADDSIYANKVFTRWKNYGYTADDVASEVTKALHAKYKTFLSMWKKSGREFPAPRR